MNPNTYLKSMWRNSIKPIVFVAMSFEDRFEKRFNEIIKPAIENENILGMKLEAYRVDLSKSGESILTEISDGIAHCFLFLADVSTVDVLRFSEKLARNSNVLYEVGIALACWLPEEVLLIRDDNDPLIFDTSSIPHKNIDFSNNENAIREIRTLLVDRASERKMIKDARVLLSLQHLAPGDLNIIRYLAKLDPTQSADFRKEVSGKKIVSIPTARALENLLANDLVVAHSITDDHGLTYKLTDIGRSVAERYDLLIEKRPTGNINEGS